MVKVREEPFSLRMPNDGDRSTGVHLSDIIRSMAFATGVLDPKWKTQEDCDKVLMQIGLAWEDYLAKYQHPEIVFHPGEVERDGVMMSPDGFSIMDGDLSIIGIDPAAWILHEFKFTRKSCRDFAEALRLRSKKVLMWLWQIECYCLAMGTLVAKLHVMFVNGNYSRDDSDPESRPVYRIYQLRFTQEELEKTWRLITAHSKEMELGERTDREN